MSPMPRSGILLKNQHRNSLREAGPQSIPGCAGLLAAELLNLRIVMGIVSQRATLFRVLASLLLAGTPFSLAQRKPSDLFQQLRAEQTTDQAAQQLLKFAKANSAFRNYLAVHLPPMIEAGPQPSFEAWKNAVKLAGELKLVEAAPALAKWINERDGTIAITLPEEVRLTHYPAARALVRIGNAAISAVEPVLDQGDLIERYKAADVLILIGSQRACWNSLRALAGVWHGSDSEPKPPAGPVEVVKDFVTLEVSGAVLAPGGWERASESLLRREPLAQEKEIFVISNDYAVSRDVTKANQVENANEAEVYLGYDHLGVIGPDLKWRPPNPQLYPASGFRFRLVLGKNYWEPVPGSQAEREITGSPRWRIDLVHAPGPVRVLFLTKASAMRYVADVRGKTADPAVKVNADATLAALKKLKD
jgi:hypothetical protein